MFHQQYVTPCVTDGIALQRLYFDLLPTLCVVKEVLCCLLHGSTRSSHSLEFFGWYHVTYCRLTVNGQP